MDKEILQSAWKAHGDRLKASVDEFDPILPKKAVDQTPGVQTTSIDEKKLRHLAAAAKLYRFLDHPRDLMKLDAEADRHLSARNAQGEWRVNGYDRVALQAHQERLASEHQWFMEYKRESGISPVYPAQVRHGAQLSELSEDGRSVVTRWDTQTLPGLIRQGWEDLKTEAPHVVQNIRQAWDERGPSDRTMYELCVSLNQTAAGGLGGITAPIGRVGMTGKMASEVWGEAAGMAYKGPAEQTCRLVIPRGAPSLAEWQRQVIGDTPGKNGLPGLQVHQGGAVAHVDVPASWLASHAVADELAARSSMGQLQPQEAQAILQQVAEPETGMAALWPALLAQAGRDRADALRLPENDATEIPGRAWVADSPMLSPMQKANFLELVNHFEAPLAQLTVQDRRLAEQVMALRYVDEVSVHGGMDEPVASKLAALARSQSAPSAHSDRHSMPPGGAAQQDSQSLPPSGLGAYQQALNQAMAPLWKENEAHGHWTFDQVQQLQTFALRTAVHHHLGPGFKGAWLSNDGQRIGVMDSIGVLRDFAVADALEQSPEQSWSEAARSWEASTREAAVARAGSKNRGASDSSQPMAGDVSHAGAAEAVTPPGPLS